MQRLTLGINSIGCESNVRKTNSRAGNFVRLLKSQLQFVFTNGDTLAHCGHIQQASERCRSATVGNRRSNVAAANAHEVIVNTARHAGKHRSKACIERIHTQEINRRLVRTISSRKCTLIHGPSANGRYQIGVGINRSSSRFIDRIIAQGNDLAIPIHQLDHGI